jgi:GTPase SAR1 family protein
VSLQSASQEEGRNALIHRYLLNNLDWIDDELGDYDSDYLIIDCPGQIELYTHIPLLPRLLTHLQVSLNFRTSAAYLIDSQFMQDKTKFFAGVMSAMSCMLSLGVSMVCVMSKMDLVKDSKGNIKREVGRYVSLSPLDYLESNADW